ncbi:PAS domain-containing sensor histidine kinase [Cysteiniphilum sp. JM-1]|uniref:PAS domain-containing sensor histidine kinase n=1 Tax=Cysteiniphilum sp. JM-1 TaxID=2610891 RepID=UPI001244D9F0|nr:PAS domain-containing sensor histidine kinase [Cysteiniphilum sp. JM-1]
MTTEIDSSLRNRIQQLEEDNAKLMAESSLLRQVIDQVDVRIYWKSADGDILGTNRKNVEILLGQECSAESIIGKSEMDFEHTNKYTSEIIENDKKVLQSGGVIEFEEEYPDSAGNVLVFLSKKSCLKDYAGKVIGVVAVSVDITKQKHAEAQLKYGNEKLGMELSQSNNILQQLIDQIPANVFWKDLDGYYLGCNASMAAVVGMSVSEIIGKKDTEINWGMYGESLAINDKKALFSYGVLQIEETIIRQEQDQKEFIYLSSKSPLKSTDGGCCGVIGIAIDITDRKQKEEALATKTVELEAEKVRIQEFIHNFHHDLRTPITGVLSNLALLKTHSAKIKDDQFHRSLALVSEGIYAVSEMTEQLYRYSKDLTQVNACDGVTIDIEKLVQQELNLAMVSIGSRHIVLDHFFMPKHIPRLKGDYIRLMQILRNLLSNSVKYTFEGKIEVIVQILKPLKEGVLLRITVADTGAGIAKEDKERIFEIGFRAEKHRKSAVHGTGFGLALVKQNLEALNGTFGVTSVLGQGTEIWVDIPLKLA